MPSLTELYIKTRALFEVQTPDSRWQWIKDVLPEIVPACRNAVHYEPANIIEKWLAWVQQYSYPLLTERGSEQLALWRNDTLQMQLTSALHAKGWRGTEQALAAKLNRLNEIEALRTNTGFWRCFSRYLLSPSDRTSPTVTIACPVVLNQYYYIDGMDTNILMIHLTAEKVPGSGHGQVYLHPEEYGLRYMDSVFSAACFQYAPSCAAQSNIIKFGHPDIAIRIHTRNRDHEKYLLDATLCQGSVGGAVASALYCVYSSRPNNSPRTAVSISLTNDQHQFDGSFYSVDKIVDKIRGCAKAGIDKLIIAEAQSSDDVSRTADLNGISLERASSINDVVGLLRDASTTRPRAAVNPNYITEVRSDDVYVVREADGRLDSYLLETIQRGGGIVTIKGPRQSGKTTLAKRTTFQLTSYGIQVVYTDLRSFPINAIDNPDTLTIGLAESWCAQLGIDINVQDLWDRNSESVAALEILLRDYVLPKSVTPLIWVIDGVERLISCKMSAAFFGYLRSYHVEKNGVSLLLTLATEPTLLITSHTMSPFNVALELTLSDFTEAEMSSYNERLGFPLTNDDLATLYWLLGGQPMLVTRGFKELMLRPVHIESFVATADKQHSIYANHLMRILAQLRQHVDLLEGMRSVLTSSTCASPEVFFRLWSAGLVSGNANTDVHPRCELYKRFFSRQLLHTSTSTSSWEI